MNEPTLYKVLNASNRSMHGGHGRWTPGRWRSVSGPLVPCKNGLHLCRIGQLADWIGPRIWIAETDGEVIEEHDKVIARRARITREVTPTDAQWRHFAADCAEDALHLARPQDRETLAALIATARAYADGTVTDADPSAGRSSAWAAAWAASAVAWHVMRAAGRDDARAAQTARLAALLGEDR